MTDRITPSMVTSSTLADLGSSLAALERSTNELSSGKTILAPSDNPYGASRVIDLQSQLEGLTNYEGDAQDGIAWENTASSAMSNMNELAQRVRELVVESANGTNNQSDLNTLALEIEQLTESVKQDASTQYAGQYVFSGTATTTPPYEQGVGAGADEFKGNEETVSRAVGPAATVSISTNISTLLGSGEAAKDGKLLDTLRTIVGHLRSRSPRSARHH
jgi:flagellar hook-associated protein 3 FlgL